MCSVCVHVCRVWLAVVSCAISSVRCVLVCACWFVRVCVNDLVRRRCACWQTMGQVDLHIRRLPDGLYSQTIHHMVPAHLECGSMRGP